MTDITVREFAEEAIKRLCQRCADYGGAVRIIGDCGIYWEHGTNWCGEVALPPEECRAEIIHEMLRELENLNRSREMTDLQKQIGEWGVETFPTATNRSIAQHLLEEADEVENAAKKQGIGLMEECADVLLLLLHMAHRNGFDLEQAARQKFETIRNAEWIDDGRGYKKRVK